MMLMNIRWGINVCLVVIVVWSVLVLLHVRSVGMMNFCLGDSVLNVISSMEPNAELVILKNVLLVKITLVLNCLIVRKMLVTLGLLNRTIIVILAS